MPPRQGINGLCRCPQNQNDYEIGYTRPMLTTPRERWPIGAGCGKYAVTVRTILRFPDHHLRATAQRVVVFDEDLCSLATDLLDTLRAASAIGITATHIGVLKRLTVIELIAADGVRTYVNPRIVWASADMIRQEEGSVSMPGAGESVGVFRKNLDRIGAVCLVDPHRRDVPTPLACRKITRTKSSDAL